MRLLAVLALVAACGAPPAKPPSTSVSGKLPPAIPGEASLVIRVGSPVAFIDALNETQLDAGEAKALKDEAFAFLEERTGLKLANAGGVTLVFGLGETEWGVALLEQVEGKLSGTAAGEHEGVPLVSADIGPLFKKEEDYGRYDRDSYEDRYPDDDEPELVAAQSGTTLIIGSPYGVRAVLDTAAGRKDPLTKTDPKLAELIDKEGAGAYALVALSVASLPEEGRREISMYGVERAVVTLKKGGVRAVALGPDAGLKRLEQTIKGGIALINAEILKRKAMALEPKSKVGAIDGVVYIVAEHMGRQLEKTLVPKVGDGKLEIDLKLPIDGAELALPMFVGIGSAVFLAGDKSEAPRAYDRDYGP